MIYLPYTEHYTCALRLDDPELRETHQGLIQIVRWRNKRLTDDDLNPDEGYVIRMFQDHWDSFFTLGLYIGTECRTRGIATVREHKTWQKYWQSERKFRRKVNHPEFSREFHYSVREYLAWLRPDPYLDRFALEEEPFMEPMVLWPT